MASEFSDPAWWPKPPPQPPKPISVSKIVVGTIIPIIALIVGAVIVFTQHSSPSHSSTQSLAAWRACLKAHGVTQGASGTDTNTVRSAEQACRPTLPPGTQLGTFGAGSSEQEQLSECMRNATAGIPRGRFSSAARQQIQNAFEVCQTLIQGGGGSTLEPTTTTTPAAPPAA